PLHHDRHYVRWQGAVRFPDRESTSDAPAGHADGMVALTQAIVVHAAAEAVWQVVAGGFDRIGEWATAIPASTACPITDSATGSATQAPVPGRVCRTGVTLVPEVTETIVAFDDTARTLTYEASAGMPSFVTLARNRWQVFVEGERQSRV